MAWWICVLGWAGAATPEAFEADGQWGLRAPDGTVLVTPRYAVMSGVTSEGIVAAAGEGGWVWLDASGAVVARPFVFDNGADPFVEGRARVVDDIGRVGFIDVAGQAVVHTRWVHAERFVGGVAAVCAEGRRVPDGEHTRLEGCAWGLVDRVGTVLVPPTLPSVEAARAAGADSTSSWARHTLTLEPRALTDRPADGTVFVAPGSTRQAAAYTHYVLDRRSIDAVVGGLPTSPVAVEVEVWSERVEVRTPTDPRLPAPSGGFELTVREGRVVGAVGPSPDRSAEAASDPE